MWSILGPIKVDDSHFVSVKPEPDAGNLRDDRKFHHIPRVSCANRDINCDIPIFRESVWPTLILSLFDRMILTPE